MPSKKKFEGPEVSVTAPRMNKFEEGLYDRRQMTPKQKRDEAVNMAIGFALPPAGARNRIDYSKGHVADDKIVDTLIESGKFAAETGVGQFINDRFLNKKYARGGVVKPRGNGIAKRGLTKGKMR
jgi:hypothetical protein